MKKAEKQQRDEYLRQWNMPRDDLECDDLKVRFRICIYTCYGSFT